MANRFHIWNATAVCHECGDVESFSYANDNGWAFEDGAHMSTGGIINGSCPNCVPIQSFIGWVTDALFPSALHIEYDNDFDGGSDREDEDDDSDADDE